MSVHPLDIEVLPVCFDSFVISISAFHYLLNPNSLPVPPPLFFPFLLTLLFIPLSLFH